MQRSLETLENFRGCSGLELNKSETEALWLGCWATRNNTPFEFRWPENYVYALGIHFSNDRSKCESLNFDKKLEDLEKNPYVLKKEEIDSASGDQQCQVTRVV